MIDWKRVNRITLLNQGDDFQGINNLREYLEAGVCMPAEDNDGSMPGHIATIQMDDRFWHVFSR